MEGSRRQAHGWVAPGRWYVPEAKGHWIRRDQTEDGSEMLAALYAVDILPIPALC